jgi:hypothetical protein
MSIMGETMGLALWACNLGEGFVGHFRSAAVTGYILCRWVAPQKLRRFEELHSLLVAKIDLQIFQRLHLM